MIVKRAKQRSFKLLMIVLHKKYFCFVCFLELNHPLFKSFINYLAIDDFADLLPDLLVGLCLGRKCRINDQSVEEIIRAGINVHVPLTCPIEFMLQVIRKSRHGKKVVTKVEYFWILSISQAGHVG